MKPLAGQVAVVAGATRGAGRGVAVMLGEAGASVYCTGRSSRTQPGDPKHHYAGRPETIEETAELVDAAGGKGIAVRVDHTSEQEVAGLFKRVKRDHGRLDILVNILTGPPVKDWKPFWKLPLAEGRSFVEEWVWPHVTTCWHASPLMVKGGSGLIVEVTEHDTIAYGPGNLFYDLANISIKRLANGLAEELRPHGVTALALTPGFMRTEAILEQFGATESNWREAAELGQAKQYGFIGSETPYFIGRAVASLAADPEVSRWSGGVYSSWGLSEEYSFTDVNGERPHWGRFFAENFGGMFGPSAAAVKWEVTSNVAVPA